MHTIGQYGIVVLLMGWMIYRRARRTIGFQLFSPRRLWIRSVIFMLVGILLVSVNIALHPLSLLADAAGLAAGAVLVYFAIRHTVFEKRENGLYYRTHIWIQSIVLLLFLSRVVYRIFALAALGGPQTAGNAPFQSQQMTQDPLTSGVLFLLIAFYIGYFQYILRRGRSVQSGTPGVDAGI